MAANQIKPSVDLLVVYEPFHAVVRLDEAGHHNILGCHNKIAILLDNAAQTVIIDRVLLVATQIQAVCANFLTGVHFVLDHTEDWAKVLKVGTTLLPMT